MIADREREIAGDEQRGGKQTLKKITKVDDGVSRLERRGGKSKKQMARGNSTRGNSRKRPNSPVSRSTVVKFDENELESQCYSDCGTI